MADQDESLDQVIDSPELQGKFVENLKRNNKKIREDRATAIAEDGEMAYKRAIEDMQRDIKRLKRDRDALLDLSPTNADSLILATDFKGQEFTEKDLQIGITIRNLEIKLEIAQSRYKYLFSK